MKVDLLRKERWQNLHFHTTNNANTNSRNLGNLDKFDGFLFNYTINFKSFICKPSTNYNLCHKFSQLFQ